MHVSSIAFGVGIVTQRADQGLRQSPRDYVGLLVLAQADITLQNYRAALEKLDQYSRILPGNTFIDFYTGLCHEALGDISSVKTAFLRFTRGKAGPPRQEDYARRRLAAWLHY